MPHFANFSNRLALCSNEARLEHISTYKAENLHACGSAMHFTYQKVVCGIPQPFLYPLSLLQTAPLQDASTMWLEVAEVERNEYDKNYNL